MNHDYTQHVNLGTMVTHNM